MVSFAKELLSVNVEDEMRQSYLDYAMSVIVGRALPDVRDGLKPVHRRVLYAMRELGNDWNKPYKKSARVVGDVIGKYHPHGDTAVYDTIVRMAQPFSLRYLLVDGQGNFGSVDGDAPAAMRYTEVRMSKLAHALLSDLDKDTVDFAPNYDESESEPVVLPAAFPNLLVNGSSGIAVGMATNIPAHNLTEVLSACLALIDNPNLTIDEIMEYIPGPDFPTAAIINGTNGIKEAYHTGRGRVEIRARTEIEIDDKTNKQTIIVTELPYQVNKARLLEKIDELAKDKKITGISELRDESDKDGMRVVIELKRGEIADVVLNNLYQHTQMRSSFGINMLALVDDRPKTLNIKEILEAFLRHRRDIVTRRTIYELRKARDRAHILEGLAVALANIDPIIEVIRKAPNPQQAKESLLQGGWEPGAVNAMLSRSEDVHMSRPEELTDEFGLQNTIYKLSPTQAQAILDLKLQRLTALEQDKILEDYQEQINNIRELLKILTNPQRLMEVITEELTAIKEQYGDARRTEIRVSQEDLNIKDLIQDTAVVVTLSHTGYAKSQPLSEYVAQNRGGKGKSATDLKEEDFVEKMFVAKTHDTLLCFSSLGRAYWLDVYTLPSAGRNSKGKPIVNLLPLQEGEKINALLAIREYKEDQYLLFSTASGITKKTALSEYSRPRKSGIIAVDLKENDKLVDVILTEGQHDILMFSNAGKAVRFSEEAIRTVGRTATGVRGMKLHEGERVISVFAVYPEQKGTVLTVSENGYGKRTELTEYPRKSRSTSGVITMKTSERNGLIIGAVLVAEDDDIMLISNQGTLIRMKANGISIVGRNTQGVRLIRLEERTKLVEVERLAANLIEEEIQNMDIEVSEQPSENNEIKNPEPENKEEDGDESM